MKQHWNDKAERWEPPTHADRIRSMSDEEMADFLMDTSMGMLMDKRIMNVKDWLQQPAEEVIPNDTD